MIHRETSGAVTVLRVEHGKANAIDAQLFADLERELDAAENAGALVLTGSGSIFSAGVDLFKVIGGGAPYLEEYLPVLSATLRRLFAFERPVVAAINGHAIAGGCILAAACDHRIMNRDAGRIGVTELLVGVPFPAVPLETMRFLLPARDVQSLIYSGRTMDAAEALELGLVDEIAAGERVLAAAIEAAERLAALPAGAFALTKRQIRTPALERMAALGAATDGEILDLWSRPETHDRIRMFLEKTVGKK